MNRTTMMILFMSIMTTMMGLLHYYFWLRLIKDTALPRPWREVATAAIIVLALCLPFGMIMGRSLPYAASRIAVFLPYVWMGLMVLLFSLLIEIDVAKLLYSVCTRLFDHSQKAPDPARRIAMRRLFAGGALLFAGGLGGLALYKGKRAPVHRRIHVVLDRLPARLDGFRIVQLTDIHIGGTLDGEWLSRVVARVNALAPDLIVITGDLVDGYVEHLKDQVAPIKALAAPHGVFFVTGNHEYYFGVGPWIATLKAWGIRVLRNERVPIGRGDDTFDLVGIDDFNAHGMAPGHGPDLHRALSHRDPERESVLLAHQPRAIGEAAQQHIGLVLSGHTHGGQIWPITHLVGLQQPYNTGLHRRGGTQIYISQGTGFWGPPMRLGTENELTEIVLRARAKARLKRAGLKGYSGAVNWPTGRQWR